MGLSDGNQLCPEGELLSLCTQYRTGAEEAVSGAVPQEGCLGQGVPGGVSQFLSLGWISFILQLVPTRVWSTDASSLFIRRFWRSQASEKKPSGRPPPIPLPPPLQPLSSPVLPQTPCPLAQPCGTAAEGWGVGSPGPCGWWALSGTLLGAAFSRALEPASSPHGLERGSSQRDGRRTFLKDTCSMFRPTEVGLPGGARALLRPANTKGKS